MQSFEKLVCSGLIVLLMAGCGGGDGGSDASTPPPATSVNAPPTIQGQPATAAVVGQTYRFRATAADSNGDSLTFSAANLPSWLTIDSSSGQITGTPTDADVGNYAGIIVSVSDGRTSASLPAFQIAVTAVASGSATLSWVPPTENTDGSALIDLAGYRIRYGRTSSELTETLAIDNPSISTYILENLTTGTWYFAVIAVNGAGVESALSNVATKTIA